jgi:hypothetical protein
MILTYDLLILLFVFSTAIIFLTGFILYILLKTPAGAFLSASLKRKMVLINPREDRYIHFATAKNQGGIATIKKGASYIIAPTDTFSESKSKVPTAVVYGNMGMTLNPKQIKTTEYFQNMGLMNFHQLDELKKTAVSLSEQYTNEYNLSVEKLKDFEEKLDKVEEKEKEKLEKDIQELKTYCGFLTQKIENPLGVVIDGESINLNNTIDYLNVGRNQGDFIEAGIQRATAIKVAKGKEEILKWGFFFVLIIVGAALAYVIIMQVTGGGASIDYNALANAIAGAKANAPVGTTIT